MNVTVKLVDILGRQVGESIAAVTPGENMIDVNIQSLEAGFYFVVISNGKSNYSEKFVVE